MDRIRNVYSRSSAWHSACVRGEAQAVAVRIDDQHFAASPIGIVWRLLDGHPRSAERAVQGIDVGDDEIHRTAYFAVTGVFGQKDRLALAGELGEQRKAGFEAVLPVDEEARPCT